MFRAYFTQQDKMLVRQQYQTHKMSLAELGQYWKASKSTMQRVLKDLGIERRPAHRRPVPIPYTEKRKKPPRFSREQLDEMVQLYTMANKTKEELGLIYGCSISSITTWLKKEGVTFRKSGRRKLEKIKPPPKPRPKRLTDELAGNIAAEYRRGGVTWQELGAHYNFDWKYLCNKVGPLAKLLK